MRLICEDFFLRDDGSAGGFSRQDFLISKMCARSILVLNRVVIFFRNVIFGRLKVFFFHLFSRVGKEIRG